jgi:uncharacterized protein YaaR (DUF327 family)|tara:strand:- start:271 stop:534 length:264 start_codon:yes stop_codon:yes gene_type:complete
MKFDLIEKFKEIQKGIEDVNYRLSKIESISNDQPSHKYLTVKQVQSELGNITRKTLDNWHKEEILIKRYVGGRVYYKAEEVNNLLNQ